MSMGFVDVVVVVEPVAKASRVSRNWLSPVFLMVLDMTRPSFSTLPPWPFSSMYGMPSLPPPVSSPSANDGRATRDRAMTSASTSANARFHVFIFSFLPFRLFWGPGGPN